ncbi:MAG TPA: ATP-binding protein [Candidatus Binataceae bacterium]|jgi:DNA topoisomerase VI subunit B|nr:ATP-binding protein [Candidatus Binataceae bacterium]
MAEQLNRIAFTTDRTLEFFTESELRTQLGYGRELWPVVLVKELIDNGLDAGEATAVAPVITVTLEADAITVADNGPGISANIIEKSLDYYVRISDKKGYISPTRGQLGNALKCVWAAPFVVTGEGLVEVTACGLHHRIQVGIDRIAQRPQIDHTTEPFVQNGTSITVRWAAVASYETGWRSSELYKDKTVADVLPQIVADYAALNPHATFHLKVPDRELEFAASDPGWSKWRTNQPTSSHWYTREHLRDLIAAYVQDERDGGRARTVREFVAEFDGLRRSRHQAEVTDEAGIAGYLHDLVGGDGDLDLTAVQKLLTAMRAHSRPVKPDRLGVIGKDHMTKVLAERGAAPESIKYKKDTGIGNDGLPFVVEGAFGVKETRGLDRIIGLNFSPVFKVPAGYIADALSSCRVQPNDPVVLAIHLACPRFPFVDHGKGALADDNIYEAVDQEEDGE